MVGTNDSKPKKQLTPLPEPFLYYDLPSPEAVNAVLAETFAKDYRLMDFQPMSDGIWQSFKLSLVHSTAIAHVEFRDKAIKDRVKRAYRTVKQNRELKVKP